MGIGKSLSSGFKKVRAKVAAQKASDLANGIDRKPTFTPGHGSGGGLGSFVKSAGKSVAKYKQYKTDLAAWNTRNPVANSATTAIGTSRGLAGAASEPGRSTGFNGVRTFAPLKDSTPTVPTSLQTPTTESTSGTTDYNISGGAKLI